MTATSGFVSSAFSTASFPSPASATTCQFGWASTIRRNPDLTTSWSSAIRIRIMVTTPGVLRQTYRNAPVAPLQQTLMSCSSIPDHVQGNSAAGQDQSGNYESLQETATFNTNLVRVQ